MADNEPIEMEQFVRVSVRGAESTLRAAMLVASRDEARRMHAMMTSICLEIAERHSFPHGAGRLTKREERRK